MDTLKLKKVARGEEGANCLVYDNFLSFAGRDRTDSGSAIPSSALTEETGDVNVTMSEQGVTLKEKCNSSASVPVV